ncbi:RluA family pseudouridine synthase [Desulfovibrio sp. SGI.169]|uniref:RluA family pseudouridine synthase n=1 Tax=Desulfovibrio sp. SGI.169 TaxID=3420561 RepID=UPI003CFE08C6
MPSDDLPPDPAQQNIPVVGEAESGQKILQFLQRRLNLPPALLHRWIRTGQVRLNGGRCKPFARVQTGDMLRLPPFALKMAAQSGAAPTTAATQAPPPPEGDQGRIPPLPPVVGTAGAIWALRKPAGLPTHPGTGHSDSLATRLAARYDQAAFRPTPAHRLDKDTSGVLLVAASFEALRRLQEAIRERALIKEYVAWVRGGWPWAETRLLRHHLRKETARGYEKMRAVNANGAAREALCLVRPLRVRAGESLLLIRLFTGRTHQIRVQLASLGHPVLGDAKYGPQARPAESGPMYLHALRVILPGGRVFACLPDWAGEHAVSVLPEVMAAPANLPPEIPVAESFPLAGNEAI